MNVMSDLYKSKEFCTGCTACYSICPVNAIKMENDDEGFAYPVINKSVCVNCGKCQKVCPVKCHTKEMETSQIYAVKCKNESVRMNSSSGGAFSIIAEWVEKQSGVIYGAAFDDKFSVKHSRGETRKEWQKFRSSKYVQSELGETFKHVKNDLLKNKMVLFTGTPCQVDGLHKFLQKIDTSRLITCDIICHGTPSPKVWDDYLNYIQKTFADSITKVNFRDKQKTGWHNSNMTIWGKRGQILISEGQKDNLFFQLFFRHLILKPSCYSCLYSNFNRPGDITLGDYWGIEKYYSDFDDDKGVSLFMCNTDTGKNVWTQVCEKIDYFEIKKEECLQPNLQSPSWYPKERKEFWKMYRKYGIKRVGQKMEILPLTIFDQMYWLMIRIVNKLKRITEHSINSNSI